MATIDFLEYELRMSKDEISNLNFLKITRLSKDDTDRIYVHLEDQTSSHYLYRKGAKMANHDIKISPFIPPQL